MARPAPKKNQLQPKIDFWRNLPLGDIFLRLDSNSAGLSQVEAQKRLKQFGPNVSDDSAAPWIWENSWKYCLNPLMVLLTVAVSFSIFFGFYRNAVILSLILGLNVLSFIFLRTKTKPQSNSFNIFANSRLAVKRDGRPQSISWLDIVPGDVVLLKPGNMVPADARIIRSWGLRTLTNLKKYPVLVHKSEIKTLGQVRAGEAVLDGSAEVIVFNTGRECERYLYFHLNLNHQFPFEGHIAKLCKFLSLIIAAGFLLIFGWSRFFIKDFNLDLVVAGVTVLGVVPAILNWALVFILNSGFKEILGNGGWFRSSAFLEKLGKISVILTDNPGLLSLGEVNIVKVLVPQRPGGIFELKESMRRDPSYLTALSYGLLSFGYLLKNTAQEPDKSFLMAALAIGLDYEKLNSGYRKMAELVWSGGRDFTVSIRENPAGGVSAMVLGVAESLLPRLKKIQILDRIENISVSEVIEIKETIQDLAKNGLNVLAVCHKKVTTRSVPSVEDADFVKAIVGELVLVGLIVLRDRLQSDTVNLMKSCHEAGIRLVIVTSQNSSYAKAIAGAAGWLPQNKNKLVLMEGKELDSYNIKELTQRIRSVDIFSGLAPGHRLKILGSWQLQLEAVAVVGGSAEEVLALGEADLALSFENSTVSAREISDLVLKNAGLKSIVAIVKIGREVRHRIEKSFVYLLGFGLGQVILIGLVFILNLPLPFTLLKLLWAILIESFGLMTLVLGEGGKLAIAAGPPTSSTQSLLNAASRFLIVAISVLNAAASFVIFIFFKSSFDSLAFVETAVLAAWGIMALLLPLAIINSNVPIAKIFSRANNKALVYALIPGILFLGAGIYWPSLNHILNTEPLGLLEWLIIAGISLISLILIGIAGHFLAKGRAAFK